MDNHCTYCQERLSEEEWENPETEPGTGFILCDECYQEEFEYECCRCKNFERDLELNMDDLECLLVVAPEPESWAWEDGVGVPRGIYRIIRHPYCGGPLIGRGGTVFRDALELVTPHLNECDPTPYPLGHLCRECAERIGRLRPPRVAVTFGRLTDAEVLDRGGLRIEPDWDSFWDDHWQRLWSDPGARNWVCDNCGAEYYWDWLDEVDEGAIEVGEICCPDCQAMKRACRRAAELFTWRGLGPERRVRAFCQGRNRWDTGVMTRSAAKKRGAREESG